MSSFEIIPTFLDSPQGRIFVIHRIPRSLKIRSGVVLVPPFAEELNRSRRMLTLLADALAEGGHHVMLPDFYGTGDSEGEFSEASWSGWLDQLVHCFASMQSDYGISRYSLVAVRTGALLVADCLQRLPPSLGKLVFWLPVIDGDVYLNQFLRLRLASNMLAGDERVNTQSLKQLLADGEVVEVAGYALTSAVADGLLNSSLKRIDVSSLPETCWIDLVAREGVAPPLPNRNLIETWDEAEVNVQHRAVAGELFWNSAEIIENPELVSRTVDFLEGEMKRGL